ncbi:MAG: SMP-30/gluconolactonase/LRE family protein [Cyclobacteriaceae bacterium]
MKRFFLISGAFFLILIAFAFYTMLSTGFFREINNTESYQIIAEIPLNGAEDFTIDYENEFMIISQDDRAARINGRKRSGGLYYLSLRDSSFSPIRLTTNVRLLPHGISLMKLDSERHQLLVVNHAGKHTIEKFELFGDSLVHIETFEDEFIVSPNDVVALNEGSFYFTNDHGYTSKFGLLLENYLGLSVSDVVLFDGSYHEVARNIAYANGINISRDRSQIIVASPRSFKLLYYTIQDEGDLEFSHYIKTGTGADNIEPDQNGDLWIGCHPSLLDFTRYAAGAKQIAPSEVIKITADGQVESLFENDGALISASSVAASYKDLLFIGTVMDDKLLVLKEK